METLKFIINSIAFDCNQSNTPKITKSSSIQFFFPIFLILDFPHENWHWSTNFPISLSAVLQLTKRRFSRNLDSKSGLSIPFEIRNNPFAGKFSTVSRRDRDAVVLKLCLHALKRTRRNIRKRYWFTTSPSNLCLRYSNSKN